MSDKKEEREHSRTVWSNTKDEAALVASGVILGGAVGTVGGFTVSQLAGTPLVPSMVVGGVTGAAVGGTVAAYGAHRLHEAEAAAMRHADAVVVAGMSHLRKTLPKETKPEILTLQLDQAQLKSLEKMAETLPEDVAAIVESITKNIPHANPS